MKKLLLAVIFSAFFGQTFAQNEYLQNNPEWTVLRGFSAFYPCIEYDSAHYYLNGDSVYNSYQWKVMWQCGHVWHSWQSPNPNMSCYGNYTYCDTIPVGLIRSQGKQMFFVMWNDTTEQLLYDFNMTIGSQPPQTYTYCCPGPETITAIDSFYTPYGYRKRFYLNNNWQPDFIEGVGSSYGLIEPFGPMLDQFYQLICYGMNDTAWYPSQGPYCNVITDATDQAAPSVSFQLLPNPATEFVDVQLTNAAVDEVELYDVHGQLVKSQASTRIDATELAPGIYFIRVRSGQAVLSEKLIIE